MAFWNAPLATEGHERRACLAALAMFDALEELNKTEAVTIKIGVGLNTGICCVGNLGSEQRFSYSAIGDAVNVSARVEGLTKQYGLRFLMTEMTAANAGDLAVLEVDHVRVVGRSEPVAIFTLLGNEAFAGTPEFSALAAAHGKMLDAYRSRDFASATNALEEARQLAPAHLAAFYDIYAKRLVSLAANPPAADWDGVFNVIEK
jgi:adenylate cyclase